MVGPVQRSFDDLGTPLSEVTFVVLDLETTGGSPGADAITEVGAVKVRGGEQLGTFATLVNPGVVVPPSITVLTGITQAMVLPAPPIRAVLAALSEFLDGAVVVGHNVRFDLRFLDAALVRAERPRLSNRWVDTLALARRLVRDEVPDLKLGTLAERLRLPNRPTHRALDDALATADLLHCLLERTGRLGVTGLDDLLALPAMAQHPQAAKLALTDRLPRAPGVYLMRDARGEVLYVGKATDLRARVRSYFSVDSRRKVAGLLRETARIDHHRCEHPLEAAVREVRLIHAHEPRYNREHRRWRSYAYLQLTDEAFPRLAVSRNPRRSSTGPVLGPLASMATARLAAEAIESVLPLRRCSADPRRSTRCAPCAPAQLGVSACPCSGGIDPGHYHRVAVEPVVTALTERPCDILDPLEARMVDLAAAGRYEEAASTRDRAGALSKALERNRRFDKLRAAGCVALVATDGSGVVLERGSLASAWGPRPGGSLTDSEGPGALSVPAAGALPRELADELSVVGAWVERHAAHLEVRFGDATVTSRPEALHSFEPVGRRAHRPSRHEPGAAPVGSHDPPIPSRPC